MGDKGTDSGVCTSWRELGEETQKPLGQADYVLAGQWLGLAVMGVQSSESGLLGLGAWAFRMAAFQGSSAALLPA